MSDIYGIETTGGRYCVVCNQMHLASARCYSDPLGFSAERAMRGVADAAEGRALPASDVFRRLRDTTGGTDAA